MLKKQKTLITVFFVIMGVINVILILVFLITFNNNENKASIGNNNLNCAGALESWCKDFVVGTKIPAEGTYRLIYTDNRFAINNNNFYQCSFDQDSKGVFKEFYFAGSASIKADGYLEWNNKIYGPKIKPGYEEDRIVSLNNKTNLKFIKPLLLKYDKERKVKNVYQLQQDDKMSEDEIKDCFSNKR